MLLSSGMSPQMIRTRLESGHLVRVRRGVYLAAASWPDDDAGRHLMTARAELVLTPAAVLSHETAALVWGLPHPGLEPWESRPPSVSELTYSGAKSRSGSVVHHLAMLPVGHITRDGAGYAVTTPARTAVDLAAKLDLPQALVLLDAAARQVCDGMMVRIRRSDYANQRLIGAMKDVLVDAAHARRSASLATAIALTHPARESAAESLSAGHFHLAGLPTPLFQHMIRTPLGTFYPDFYWPEHRLIGECDGAVKYVDKNAMLYEKQREQALLDEGNRFVRWMAREVMVTPQIVVDRVARALGW
jgi:very-short-patch-repair endonuclease